MTTAVDSMTTAVDSMTTAADSMTTAVDSMTTTELKAHMLYIQTEIDKRNLIANPTTNKYRLIKETIYPLPFKLWYVPVALSDNINDYNIERPFAQREVLLCGETTCRRSIQQDNIGMTKNSLLKWATDKDLGEDVETHVSHYVMNQKRKSKKLY